ncbi:MAG: hypothetical protein KY475_24780, partial [Planctomycetes bacterium]|nr:hypothetical protein [Planctomycetota bacterium]
MMLSRLQSLFDKHSKHSRRSRTVRRRSSEPRCGARLLRYETLENRVVLSATTLQYTFGAADGAALDDINLNGTAAIQNDALRLTPPQSSQAGSAFLQTASAINSSSSFTTSFAFHLTGGQESAGADGIAFIVQNDSRGADELGGVGGDLGYHGVAPSLAIEFDTYGNGWDPNPNHIAVLVNGDVTRHQSLVTSPVDLNGGGPYYAWIDYTGTTDSLEVRISGVNARPSQATLSATGIALESFVGSQAFFGFSGGTGGLFNDQQILDWTLTTELPTADFGDAPDTYGTLLASNGAYHVGIGPQLGAARDFESDGQPAAQANGDDTLGTPDDEDGVAFSTLVAGTAATATVDLQNSDATANYLNAWLDYDQDGDFSDTGEQIFVDANLGTSAGIQTLNFTLPYSHLGVTYARFRLSTQDRLQPSGAANDGEVEDYRITIDAPNIDDGNPCTTDTYVAGVGGVHTPVPDGTVADDGDPNTINDRCEGGVVVGDPLNGPPIAAAGGPYRMTDGTSIELDA